MTHLEDNFHDVLRNRPVAVYFIPKKQRLGGNWTNVYFADSKRNSCRKADPNFTSPTAVIEFCPTFGLTARFDNPRRARSARFDCDDSDNLGHRGGLQLARLADEKQVGPGEKFRTNSHIKLGYFFGIEIGG